ncbi:MAG: TatD family hydrolase [Candidatus Micrarchaeia archaeon]
MPSKERILTEQIEKKQITITPMADSHCHLDLLDEKDIKEAIINGVQVIITDGVDTRSNMETLKIADNINIFAAIGVDPEHSALSEEELNFNIGLLKSNLNKVVAVGEIGLDRKIAIDQKQYDQQKKVFEKMLDAALDLNLPVSIHARDSIGDVLKILSEKNVKKAHLHFFDGNLEQAKLAEKFGYMISIPPFKSSKRSMIIKDIAIDNIMAESDAPAAGKNPIDVKRAIEFIASVKGIQFEKAADILLANTKEFFGINTMLMYR